MKADEITFTVLPMTQNVLKSKKNIYIHSHCLLVSN